MNSYDGRAVRFGVSQLCRRIKWAWHFRDAAGMLPESRKLVKRPVKPYSGALHAHIESLCYQVSCIVNDKVTTLNAKLALARGGSTPPRFVRYALRWIKSAGFAVDLSDKDGTFVLYSTDLKAALIQAQLHKTAYIPTGMTTVKVEVDLARSAGLSLCVRLGKLGYSQWAAESKQPILGMNLKSFVCPLNCTVKTHKPVGKLAVRLLHNCSGSAFSGLAGVVDRLIASETTRFKYLAKSSIGVQQLLNSHVYPHTAILAKIDINEFFLSGDRDFLIDNACTLFDNPKLRQWVSDALWCLSHYQIVTFAEQFFRVSKGSGMGTRHSGSLSNSAFAVGVEAPFFRKAKSLEIGVIAYVRFFDDILIVSANQQESTRAVDLLIFMAKTQFTLELESSSHISVQMLDMTIRKVRSGPECFLRWRPFIKTTARHLPLHHDSLHHPSVHLSWPLAEMSRLHRLSSSSWEFESARCKKLDKWTHFFMHPQVLQSCRDWTPAPLCTKPAPILDPFMNTRTVRFILPYHPGIRDLVGPVKSLFEVWSSRARSLHSFGINVALSWRSAGTPMHIVCRRQHL